MMKLIKFNLALMLCLACAFASCGSDDEDETTNPSQTVAAVTVIPSSDDEGVLVGEGLTFKITSFPDNTAGVYGTTKEVDKSSYTGGFVIPAYINYNGKKYAVTSIGEGAFNGFRKMSSISIPSTVNTIDSQAFQNCYNLQTLTLPTGLQTIRSQAFQDCYNLKSLTLPAGLKEIYWGAFKYCSSLTTLILPESLECITDEAFCGCNNLQKVICKSPLPIECGYRYSWSDEFDPYRDIFSGSYQVATLYVPTGSFYKYSTTYPWEHFRNIQEGAENF